MAKGELPNCLLTITSHFLFFDKCFTKIYFFFLKELLILGFFNEILYTYTDEAPTEVSINSYKKALIIGTSNTKIIIPPWIIS